MLPDEEFRSRLRGDLTAQSAPPLGSLALDSLTHGHKLRRRQRAVRVLGGTAAVVAVAVGSVTASGAFGGNASTASAASGGADVSAPQASRTATVPSRPSESSPAPSVTAKIPSYVHLAIPASWTVPAAAKVADSDWITPQAIIAELNAVIPAGAKASGYKGDYAYGGGDPRDKWAVTGMLTLTTSTGSGDVMLVVSKHSGPSSASRLSCVPQAVGTATPPGSSDVSLPPCGTVTLADGTQVQLTHDYIPTQAATILIVRTDGTMIQATVRQHGVLTDDQLFAIASDSKWNQKMDKAFVQSAATLHGDFMAVPQP